TRRARWSFSPVAAATRPPTSPPSWELWTHSSTCRISTLRASPARWESPEGLARQSSKKSEARTSASTARPGSDFEARFLLRFDHDVAGDLLPLTEAADIEADVIPLLDLLELGAELRDRAHPSAVDLGNHIALGQALIGRRRDGIHALDDDAGHARW